MTRSRKVCWTESPARKAGCAPNSEANPLGANIIAHFRYPSGLMEASLNTGAPLEAAGVRRSCRDLPAGVYHGAADDRSDCLGLEPYDFTLLHMAPEPLVDMCYPLAGLWRRPDIYRIAVWYWELENACRRNGRATPRCSTKSGRRRLSSIAP